MSGSPFGEDGVVQGLLELADTRYVGVGMLASAVGMDKHFMKVVFAAAGLDVGPYMAVTDRQWTNDPQTVRDSVAALGFPVFVKPARAGSSMGISKLDSLEELPAAIEEARRHDLKLVIEAGIVGREIECAVLEGAGSEPLRTSIPGEIVVTDTHHAFYDYTAKYVQDNAAALSCPADLPADVMSKIRDLAAVVFDAVGAEGPSRVDFFYTAEGEIIINEINTMPGFTPKSMYPQMWAASGVAYLDPIDGDPSAGAEPQNRPALGATAGCGRLRVPPLMLTIHWLGFVAGTNLLSYLDVRMSDGSKICWFS